MEVTERKEREKTEYMNWFHQR